MRVVVFVLALLGALAAGGIGYIWMSENANQREQIQIMARGEFLPAAERAKLQSQLAKLVAGPYFMLAAVPLGLLGGVLALKRRGKSAAALLFLCLTGPLAIFVALYLSDPEISEPLLLLVGPSSGLFFLAGLLSFLVKPGQPEEEEDTAQPEEEEEEEEEEEPQEEEEELQEEEEEPIESEDQDEYEDED